MHAEPAGCFHLSLSNGKTMAIQFRLFKVPATGAGPSDALGTLGAIGALLGLAFGAYFGGGGARARTKVAGGGAVSLGGSFGVDSTVRRKASKKAGFPVATVSMSPG